MVNDEMELIKTIAMRMVGIPDCKESQIETMIHLCRAVILLGEKAKLTQEEIQQLFFTLLQESGADRGGN